MAAGHEPENHSKESSCQLQLPFVLDIDLSIKNQPGFTNDLEYLKDNTAAGFGRQRIFQFSTKLFGLGR